MTPVIIVVVTQRKDVQIIALRRPGFESSTSVRTFTEGGKHNGQNKGKMLKV